MAETNYAMCLFGFMDHLWFHQTILISEPPPSSSSAKTLEKTLLIQDSLITCSSETHSEEEEEEISSDPFETIPLQDVNETQANDDERISTSPTKERQITTSQNMIISNKNRSHSSLPSFDHHKHYKQQHSRNPRYSDSGKKLLQKTMSCKTLWELELEEVKGFMDLGFIFNKQHINKRMMSVIPGLQRLDQVIMSKDDQDNLADQESTTTIKDHEDYEEEEEDDKRDIMRPYLSEAWLVNKQDSPLLNLRIPRIYAAADMKKHLKYWAKTVANVVQQES